MGDLAIWLRVGGKINESLNYVGGDYEMLLLKKDVTYSGLRKMIAKLLNVDESVRKMELNFETGVPFKPLYGVTDDRTLEFYMHHARQESTKYFLLVTVGEESVRHGKVSEKEKTEEQNLSDSYIPGLDSINEVPNMGTSSNVAEDHGFPELFANSYVNEMPMEMPSPGRSLFVSPTPIPSFVDVVRNASEGNEQGTAAEDVRTTPVEPYQNVPPIPISVVEANVEGSECGDQTCVEEGIYGEGGILGDIEEHRIFRLKKELMTCVSITAMTEKFQYKVFKSKPSFVVVRCIHTSCSWRVRAKKLVESEYWMVTKYEKNHTCPTDFKPVRRRQATSWVVGECVKRKLINPGRVYRPRDVMDDMKRKFGVDISYSVAWRGRECAYDNLRLGTPEQSYKLLPGYLHMLMDTNPGSVVNLEVSNGNRFQYLFIAFAASIHGFSYCRPVISIDATHLKGKYRGVLFTAVCHDANQQIFPLAFGVGDSENDASWSWFLHRVKSVFGINNAVQEVFPQAFHGICMYHLLNNLKTKFRNKTKELEQHYIRTAKTYNLQDFHVLFYTLSSAVPGVKEYLEAVGLHRWTRSHAPSRRYNIMTTNISESLNAVLVKVRELPITALVNEIWLLCQKWFHERRTKAAGCTTMMSKDVEMKLEGRKDRAQAMGVICADQYTFDVVDGDRNYCVDMALWTCTCRKFQLDQLPCDHVLAVVRKTPYEAYDLCSLYYTREFWHETYRGVINPIPHISSWTTPQQISEFELQPPDVRTVAGRRRKRRLPSMGEELPTPKCSRCKERGHNRATCQNPIALHPTDEAGCSGSNLPTHQPIHPSDQHPTPQL
ncbi:hypothetical protein UlMin_039301 [Ulmus minor]